MRRIILLFVLLLSQALQAAPVSVPAPLEPWRGWALDGQEFRRCALIAGNNGTGAEEFLCAWPGVLQVQARADGATFAIVWDVQAETWVPLPGDAEHWPQDVRANGQPVAVVGHEDVPQLLLQPGRHELTGRIGWTHRPQSLSVPKAIGLVRLQVDGQAIAPAQFEDGELVLGRGESEAPEADALELRVYRRLHDGVPMTLDTVIGIKAAGQAREEVIGPVLPPGFVPTSIEVDAGWPARIEADGRVRIQVQPDATQVHIVARAAHVPSSASTTQVGKPWPAQEIWSYASAPEERETSASGPPQVDPAQALVPDAWRNLPAFAMSPGVPLAIQVRSRGLGPNAANRLRLDREAWLDYSGAGWTVRDKVDGQMREGWRLDARAPFRLEDARDLTADQALLVTQGDEGTGVEWRTPQVDLSAGLRVQPAAWALPVGGWRQTFDAVNTTLHLPDGYRLIAAPGADTDSGSWVSRWTLLDIFLVAIVVVFASRALGVAGAAVALGYLLVDSHEEGAPLYSLGLVLALALLLRALPDGRLRLAGGWARRTALVLLVLLVVPFAAAQLRLALYPQLEGHVVRIDAQAAEAAVRESPVMAATVAEPPPPPPPAPIVSAPAPKTVPHLPAAVLPRSAAKTAAKELRAEDAAGDAEQFQQMGFAHSFGMDRYSQDTVVQAGRGLPHWNGGMSYRLAWSGPVTDAQTVRLLIAPPWLTRLLRVLAVAALGWLLLRLAGVRRMPGPKVTALAPLLLVPLLAAGIPSPATAQAMPDKDTLQELHDRLARAPDCAPDCAAIADARVEVRAGQLQVALDVDAAAPVGVPMPMDAKSLTVEGIQVDGVQVPGLARAEPGLVLPLERGVHRVVLVYGISGDRIALAFPMKPYTIATSADGWEATGITDARLLTETLTLNRVRQAAGGRDATAPAQEFPPYVRVERTISLGLDWTVETGVQRIAPKTGGFSIRLPVLAGEKVITTGLLVRQGLLEIPMPDGKETAQWSATLDKTDALVLRAPDLADHAEVWRVRVSPMWHARFAGVPEAVPEPGDGTNAWHVFVFHPLPGESLRIAVTRPPPVSGSTQAIDDVQLHAAIRQRASEYTLGLRLRASQGGERVIGLPKDVELLAVTRNDESMNLRLENGRLSLPVQPGEQGYRVRFRDAGSVGFHNRTPAVALGLPAANIDLDLSLPEDRWILFAHGPKSGPAVLYWGELLVLLLVALGLSRLSRTPLRRRDWLLLVIGFSTFSWIAPAVVVAWLVALAWRERHGAALQGALRFDAMQVALVGLGVAAAIALVTAIPYGLLGTPDMHVVNPTPGDGALRWFDDQSRDALPSAGVVSVPMWVYRTAMLAWALWLAQAVLGWLRWALRAWTEGGWWRPLSLPKPKVRAAPAVPGVAEVPAQD